MTTSIWTHDAIVASCFAVIGTILTTLANNAVAVYNTNRAAKQKRQDDVEDDARDDRRFAVEHDNAMQEMALKTWGSIYDSLTEEVVRLKARIAELETLLKAVPAPEPQRLLADPKDNRP